MTGKPYLLGLTGSVAAGKSATAALFAAEGIPVWGADSVVHRLYAGNGRIIGQIAAMVPAAAASGNIDRTVLRAAIAADPVLLGRIEAVVHPLLNSNRIDFVKKIQKSESKLAVFDIPLLYETGAERWLDGVLVVTAPEKVRMQRLLARPGMTAAAAATLIARQMPDAQKTSRADFIIDTSTGLGDARKAVRALLARLAEGG